MANLDVKLYEKLERAGMQDNEAKVYAALLSMGGGYPSKIAQVAGVNRSTTYKILSTLSIRGLVSEFEKKNKLYYQIENPKKLERYAETRVTLAKNELESMTRLVPELEGMFSLSPNKPKVKFFENIEGVILVYQDHIEQQNPYEMLGFSNVAELMKLLDKKFIEKYIDAKAKIGITTRGIFPDTEEDVNYAKTAYIRIDKKFWPKTRHVPAKDFPFNAEITIYGEDKVSIINFTNGKIAGTIIEDKIIHDMMKMIFELSWKGTAE